jgi:hypothetical protein
MKIAHDLQAVPLGSNLPTRELDYAHRVAVEALWLLNRLRGRCDVCSTRTLKHGADRAISRRPSGCHRRQDCEDAQ